MQLERDVFIVHSKGDDRESTLVDVLIPRLHEVSIMAWLYGDWDWEHRVRRPGRGPARASGRLEELDYGRYLAGDPMPFRAPVDEVDEGTLGQMIHRSRVVLLCEPGAAGPSEGVVQERKAIAGLAKGPILVHLLWPDSDGDFFDKLRPTTALRLKEGEANAAAVDEVFAAVAAAWLVHNLQWKYGRQGGHRLLRSVVARETTLAELVEGSPHFQEPEESRAEPKNSRESAIAEIFARLRPLEASRFEKWWTEDLAVLRSRVGELGEGPAARSLRALIAEADRCWREAFASTDG